MIKFLSLFLGLVVGPHAVELAVDPKVAEVDLHLDRADELYERVGRSGELLFQLQDEETGRVPCYGQNDGALVLPLNNCDPRDFRPVVQTVTMLTVRWKLLPMLCVCHPGTPTSPNCPVVSVAVLRFVVC